ncbi:MAG TPA: DUF1786 family protein [Dehalococcoidia bacterium]|nr:DUF1786 family protein [Dehalococcoidia bacterium]
MRILAVDVGTGTQDILLFDTAQPVENSVKMVMPSPTQIAARRIRRATEQGRPVLLEGTIAGGGPCAWALEEHVRAGLAAFATPEAALTFDDEIEKVEAMGVRLVSDDEARGTDAERVVLRDLDLEAIRRALAAFDADGGWDAVAAGCLDHGNAPPGYSDRLFRFDHLRSVVERENDLRAFAFLPQELSEYLTRARSMVRCLPEGLPAVFLDTGPAAALGALEDPVVRRAGRQVVLNLGNMHALAFHLQGERIVSLYEHHTGEMTTEQIEDFTRRLVEGALRHEEVFGSKGHGAFYAGPDREVEGQGGSGDMPLVAVTGPQRSRLRGSALRPYLAAPHGDMMISGCFGMLRAFAYRWPAWREEIEAALEE